MKKAEALKILGITGQLETQKIDSAFKALVKEAHPDRGGTHEEMAKLNEARAILLGGIARSKELITVEDATGLLDLAYEEWRNGVEKDKETERNLSDHLDHHLEEINKRRNLVGLFAFVSFALFFAHKEIPYDLIFDSDSSNQGLIDNFRLATFCAGSLFGLFAYSIDRRKKLFSDQKDEVSTVLDSPLRLRRILKEYTSKIEGKFWTKKQLSANVLMQDQDQRSSDVKAILSLVHERDLPDVLVARGERFGILKPLEQPDGDDSSETKYKLI